MEAVKFKEYNIVFAESQPEYLPLPAHITDDGVVVTSCWSLSFLERIKVIFTGRLFLQIVTFNKPLQPLRMSVNKPPNLERSDI